MELRHTDRQTEIFESNQVFLLYSIDQIVGRKVEKHQYMYMIIVQINRKREWCQHKYRCNKFNQPATTTDKRTII